MSAGLTIYNAYRNPDLLNVADPLTGAGWGGWGISLSVGTSKSEFESVTKTTTPVASAIEAGRHVSIAATGSGADSGDITAVGTRISAGGDMALQAQRDITLAAAIGSNSETTRSRSSSASVGLSFGYSGGSLGVAVNVAASRSNGWSNGWGTTYFNTELASAGRLTLTSGRHLTLNGAKAGGQAITARVGTSGAGDLSIVSPLDESHYVAREQSAGFNVSIPVYPFGTGAPSLGLSASRLALLADYEAVRQQSALSAGVGGFDVVVNGHTHLEGGALSTEGDAGASRLVTQTLTHETLLNRDVAEGRSWSVGLNIGSTNQNGLSLALSSAGYARLDTNARSHTPSSVGGTLSVTRPDLQATRVAAMKAAEREPLTTRLAQVQQQLDWLYWNEPPPCSGCHIQSEPTLSPGDKLAVPAALDSSSTTKAGGEALDYGTSPEWLAWRDAVRTLEAERTRLNQRISAVDAKVYQDAGTLSRSPSALHQPLLHTFDRSKATQELRDGVAVTAAFGKLAYKWAGDFADQRRREAQAQCAPGAECPAADRWKDGGLYRTALHMAIGGMSFGTAGATGALASNLMLTAMDKAIAELGITDPTLINLLRTAATTMAGAAAGGVPGAVTAFNADTNNRQLHPDEVRYIRGKVAAWAARRGISLEQAEVELARGALYAVDLKWREAYGTYTPEQLAAYRAAGDFLITEARGDGFRIVNLEGVPQEGFTATPAQFQNTRYLLAQVMSDASARSFYSDRAAIALRDMGVVGAARFGGQATLGFGRGVPQGVEEGLLAYAALLDPATYERLIAAARTLAADPRQALTQALNGIRGQTQEAVFGLYLSWLQADSSALGESGGRVFGQLLVDMAAAATGVAIVNNGRRVAEGLTEVQAALARRIAAEIDHRMQNALVQSGGRLRMDGTPIIDTSGLTSGQRGIFGELFGAQWVQTMIPDGTRLGRVPGLGQTGIDDLFRVSRSDVDFVIIEYKFGTSRLGTTLDGQQMSNAWLTGQNTGYDRILEAAGGNAAVAADIQRALASGRVEKWLVHVDAAGGTSSYLLDSAGRIVSTPVSRVVSRPPGG
jgi:filamentous hemagglutinin